jgi:hypothetical protein
MIVEVALAKHQCPWVADPLAERSSFIPGVLHRAHYLVSIPEVLHESGELHASCSSPRRVSVDVQASGRAELQVSRMGR